MSIVDDTMDNFLTYKEIAGEPVNVFTGAKYSDKDLENRFLNHLMKKNPDSKIYVTTNKYAKFDIVVDSPKGKMIMIELKCREKYDYATLEKFESVVCDESKYRFLVKVGISKGILSYLITVSSDAKIICSTIYNPNINVIEPECKPYNAQKNNISKESVVKNMAFFMIKDATIKDLE